ncbi:MAG TPA: NAD(P)/FAD-dependent oxidoreductase [Mycobacteriales bacterium]|jgi:thioredoxin reductase|nr:NAD(P)/FAD-dependent oxidoreductase [Mycobacteriales bacterium]
MYDAIVVGGGPAGITATTWLARYRRRVLMVDGGEHRNRWVEQSHGYFSRDPASPRALLEEACAQLGAYPYAERLSGTVTAARRSGDGFAVTVDGEEHEALRLVLCTGVEDEFPEVDGFFDHYGASVFHCPTCDGYEAQGRDVVVLGWNEYVAAFAVTLLDWAATVLVVTDGRRFPGDEGDRVTLASFGIHVVEDVAESFVGTRGDLRGVRLRTLGEVPCGLVFFTVAHRPRTTLAAQLGVETSPEGCVLVDENGETNVPGVYAAGDLTPGMQLVQVAAAKGAVAGISAAQSLRGTRGAPASPPPAPDPEVVAP